MVQFDRVYMAGCIWYTRSFSDDARDVLCVIATHSIFFFFYKNESSPSQVNSSRRRQKPSQMLLNCFQLSRIDWSGWLHWMGKTRRVDWTNSLKSSSTLFIIYNKLATLYISSVPFFYLIIPTPDELSCRCSAPICVTACELILKRTACIVVSNRTRGFLV